MRNGKRANLPSTGILIVVTGLSCSMFLGTGGWGPAAVSAQDAPAQGDSAQGDSARQRFLAHLEAGEFVPARELAERAGGADTARMLGELAAVQAAAGLRAAALATSQEIATDYVRADAVERIRREPLGGAGGAAAADFDTLIELITSTIAPDTWDDVGGPGAIEPFPGGVRCDADGLLKRIELAPGDDLAELRGRALAAEGDLQQEVHQESKLRKVSLARLERAVQRRWAEGLPPSPSMAALAGLRKIEYVLVYPPTDDQPGDLVLAGPAGRWVADDERRWVSAATGAPVVRLDDLVVMLRNAQDPDPTFGCSITPRRENLAAAQRYNQESARKKLKPGQRDRWLDGLREALGTQEISVFGIDPRTRAAQVIVEADYRMKLVGMGIEDGVAGVTSYLDAAAERGELRASNVIRWWFTINYKSLEASPQRDAFRLVGPGVQVLSETELLTAAGERVHTGKSDPLTAQFAHSFTANFENLAREYPVYAELRNVFDLALVSSLIKAESLADRTGWQARHFLDPQRYRVALGIAPREVETVANYRVVQRTKILAGVSGGVRVDVRKLFTGSYAELQGSEATRQRQLALPQAARWWWD